MPRGVSKGNVPDTPCKKHVNGFATYPAPVPGSAVAKARHIRHSFGTPSTPFNLNGSQVGQASFGKGTGVFGSAFGRRSLARRGSFISVDGDESVGSPEANGESQVSTDSEFPPTPTKQAMGPGSASQQQLFGRPSSHRNVTPSVVAQQGAGSRTCKWTAFTWMLTPYGILANDVF